MYGSDGGNIAAGIQMWCGTSRVNIRRVELVAMATTPVMSELQTGLATYQSEYQKVHTLFCHKTHTPTPTPTPTHAHSLLAEVLEYYRGHMGYVPAQPRVRRDVLASLLERNQSEVATQQEWENEWNTQGLTSRLSEEVGVCLKETSKRSNLCPPLSLSLSLSRVLLYYNERLNRGKVYFCDSRIQPAFH